MGPFLSAILDALEYPYKLTIEKKVVNHPTDIIYKIIIFL
jgi:hypothetical protein